MVTWTSAAEARAAIVAAQKILEQLGVKLHPQKTRVVHVQQGFEFLGYKIKRGQRRLRLRPHKIQSGVREGDLYAYPKEKQGNRISKQSQKAVEVGIVPSGPLELSAQRAFGSLLLHGVERHMTED